MVYYHSHTFTNPNHDSYLPASLGATFLTYSVPLGKTKSLFLRSCDGFTRTPEGIVHFSVGAG